MTVLVLVVLAMVWIAVLVPPAVRARAEARPGDSITSFRRQLAVLQRTAPRAGRVGGAEARVRNHQVRPHHLRSVPAAPAWAPPRPAVPAKVSERTLKRRRDVFVVLLAAMGATLVISLVPSLHWFFVVHLVADALFLAYVGLLLHLRNVRAEREMKVRFLPAPPSMEPALLLRRSAN